MAAASRRGYTRGVRVLITGAGGMLGRKLANRLLTDSTLGGEPIEQLDLVDIEAPPLAATTGSGTGVALDARAVDLTSAGAAERLADTGPDVVFHLAGVVSGEAEANTAKGYRVNLDATRALLDALAAIDGCPRFVFTSSIAVFGAPFPDPIPDDFHLTPLTSYGAQKAMGELLLADYSRLGLIDGVGIRLPTITVRPGAPNAAASGFFSGIIREPLAGLPAALPVPTTVRHPHASPRSAVGFLVQAAELDTSRLGDRRNLTMPSLSVTVEDQIDALRRTAGQAAVDLIEPVDDPAVSAIVGGWPERFDTARADELGFVCESTYDEIIAAYVADDQPS